MALLDGEPCVLALHHHVGLPGFFEQGLVKRAMAFIDARQLLETLPQERSSVLFNGHRHWRYMGRVGRRLEVVSGPSTTFGDSAPGGADPRAEAGFGVYKVGWRPDRGAEVMRETWCRIRVG